MFLLQMLNNEKLKLNNLRISFNTTVYLFYFFIHTYNISAHIKLDKDEISKS